MPQMKPMMWTLMLVLTSMMLMIMSVITHFSYSNKLPHMMNPNNPINTMKSSPKYKTNDK